MPARLYCAGSTGIELGLNVMSGTGGIAHPLAEVGSPLAGSNHCATSETHLPGQTTGAGGVTVTESDVRPPSPAMNEPPSSEPTGKL
ncbi:MAG TPA: hypothetical protein VH044_00740 [Polyangiaceae bacterium]|nr:hypothetical protein [Polyangiaceae bacterium]